MRAGLPRESLREACWRTHRVLLALQPQVVLYPRTVTERLVLDHLHHRTRVASKVLPT